MHGRRLALKVKLLGSAGKLKPGIPEAKAFLRWAYFSCPPAFTQPGFCGMSREADLYIIVDSDSPEMADRIRWPNYQVNRADFCV